MQILAYKSLSCSDVYSIKRLRAGVYVQAKTRRQSRCDRTLMSSAW